MKRRMLSLFVLLGIAIESFSQDKELPQITNIAKITFFNPGISYEKAIGSSQSLYGQAFMNTSFSIGYSSTFGNTSSISFDPAFTIQYRYYYNYTKRQQKRKRTEMNSLNYLGPAFQTVFSKDRVSDDHYMENKARPINTIGVVWGFQRNYKSRFSLDLNLGLGCLFTSATVIGPADEPIKDYVAQFTTLGELNLGFWLNKRH